MTDISVKIDSSRDLVGVPFSKADENESDPLALHGEEVNNAENGVTIKGKSDGNTEEFPGGGNGDETSVLEEELYDVDAEIKPGEVSITNNVTITKQSILDSNAPTPDLPDPLSPDTNDVDSAEITKAPDESAATNITVEKTVPDDHSVETVPETESVSEPITTEIDLEGVKEKEESKPLDTFTDAKMTDDESISVEERVRKLFEADITDLESKKTENKIKEINHSVSEKVEIDNKQEIQQKPKTDVINSVAENTKPVLEKSQIVPEKTETVVVISERVSKAENTHTEIKALLDKPIEKDSSKTDTVTEKSKPVFGKTEISKPVETNLKTMFLAEPLTVSENKVTSVEKQDIPYKVNVPEKAEKMDVDVEKTNIVPDKIRVKNFELKENKSINVQPINGDVAKDDQRTKRRASNEKEESPMKRLCQEVEKSYPNHESIVNEYLQSTAKNNVEEIETHTELLLTEIQTLRESIEKKEQEWNSLLHLKKVKEEILLRLIRRKQVLSYEQSPEINGSLLERNETVDYLNQSKTLAIDKSDEISGLSLKHPHPSLGLRQSVSPITPIQNLNAMTPGMPNMPSMPSHFNPMVGLPPPYDKAAAAHMQNMSNNMQNMSNSMQTMSNNLHNIQNMSNNMQNMNVLQNIQKPVYQPMMLPGPMQGFPRDVGAMNGHNFGMPMGRQGPTKDVKSIIADYRQRNPDVTPRRGRRMKSILNPNMMNVPRNIAPKEGMNNMNNLNMLFNNLDMNQRAMLERLQQAGGLPNSIFKDALVQFANMQQQQANAGLIPNRPMETLQPVINRPEHHPKERRRMERPHEEPQVPHKPPERLPSTSPRLPPPPYPEISLLPVSTSQETTHSQSLLHGILTKPPTASTPTLKLLLSPDHDHPMLPLYGQAKNCGEITITPVAPAPEPQQDKPEEVVQLQDDEESPAPSESDAVDSPATSGRLVIDETGPAEDAPLCQGCRRRDAQFVCAGCANQWYCSRECQVAAWDDHSEMCSG